VFGALVLESTGAVNEEGARILKQIFRFAATKQNTQLSVYVGRAWARLSCNLQTSVSQAINRTSSREVPTWKPEEGPDGPAAFGHDQRPKWDEKELPWDEKGAQAKHMEWVHPTWHTGGGRGSAEAQHGQ